MKKNHSLYGKADAYVPLKKIIRKMKLTLLIVLLSVVQIFANSVYSQNTRFSLKQENTTIENVLRVIENQTEYYFLYNGKLVDVSQKVSINTDNQDIEKTLNELFRNTNISFKVYDRQIVLSQSDGVMNMQQQKSISGKVTDSSGATLPGVSVVIKGTTSGTITDMDGKYTFENVPVNATLQFSFVGMKSKEIPVMGKQKIDVVLEEETIGLEEVVAIGYGTVKKSDLTGSVAALKSDDMNPGANSSVDQMMQGRTAGVQISQSSSEPGGGLSIRIRGASSINAGNDPLYVIDGFPIDNSSNLSANSLSTDPNNLSVGQALGASLTQKNPLNSLNPSDIESIEILKDASATAIYGSRGANGVVLITTKKGKADKMTVNFDSYMGIQSVAKKIDVMSAEQYMNFINGVSADRGAAEVFSAADMAAIGSGTNWQNQIYRTAPISDHNLSVTGGVGKSRIFASLDYFNQDGVEKNTGEQKYIGRLNIDTQISDKTNIGFNMNTSMILDDNAIDGVNTNESAGPIYTSLLYDPTEPIYNEDGTFSESSNLTINNPMSLIKGVSSKSRTDRTMVNFFVNYKILEGLTAKLNFGSDISNIKRDVYVSTATIRGRSLGGFADVTSMGRSSYLAEYTMNYHKEINKNNQFDVLGGVTYQKFNFNVFNAQESGFPSDDIKTNNLSLGNLASDNISTNKEDNSLQSYLGRFNYNLYNKILLTGSIRADGSSRFGANNKYGYFPSFALGYKLSEERFIPDFFEELKLRASWGQTGNQEIANYSSLLTFGTGPFVDLDGSVQGSLRPLRIANPDLKWETTTQFNVGVDSRMLKGKINLTLDYFSKSTTDLLFNLPVPQSSGYSSILTNVGKVNNKGFEFLLNTTNITGRDFKWSTSINLTAIRNNVVDLGRVNQLTTGFLQVVGGNTAVIKVGSPLASYWGYEITGIQQQGDPNPGYPKMKDQLTVDTNGDGIPDAGDGVINASDATIIGNPNPDFTYGISNEFKYKNWILSFFIQGQQGGDLFNVMAAESMYPANDRSNRMTIMMDRWTPSNTGAKWPSATNPNSYPGGSAAKVNSLTVMDATYMRLKNAQISYNVPVAKIGFLSSLKVYVTGQNLFTITNYPGYDPEANSFGKNNVKVDYASYPLSRTFMLGLNATF